MKRPRSHRLTVLLVAAWIVYLCGIGPWLISEPSDIAVLLGVAFPIALGALTYHWLIRPIIHKEPNE